LQGSSGFRNALVTDTGAIGGKLLAVVTPKGVQPAQGTPAAELSNIYSAFESSATGSTVLQMVQSITLHKQENKPGRDVR